LGDESSSDAEKAQPRWTIPKRTRMENLHVSSFVLVKNSAGDSVVFLKAGPKYPVEFKRGKLLLPATVLDFGESPRGVASKLLGEQMNGAENLKVDYVTMQSYLGAHWDIVFVYQTKIDEGRALSPKQPFTELGFYKLSALPREQIAEDHLEVLEELRREQLEEEKENQ
jgi:hypothetical protein